MHPFRIKESCIIATSVKTGHERCKASEMLLNLSCLFQVRDQSIEIPGIVNNKHLDDSDESCCLGLNNLLKILRIKRIISFKFKN